MWRLTWTNSGHSFCAYLHVYPWICTWPKQSIESQTYSSTALYDTQYSWIRASYSMLVWKLQAASTTRSSELRAAQRKDWKPFKKLFKLAVRMRIKLPGILSPLNQQRFVSCRIAPMVCIKIPQLFAWWLDTEHKLPWKKSRGRLVDSAVEHSESNSLYVHIRILSQKAFKSLQLPEAFLDCILLFQSQRPGCSHPNGCKEA